MDFEAGLARVGRIERNNRRSSAAKGTGAATPKKAGAKRGFASNPTSGASITGMKMRGGNGRRGLAGRVSRRSS